MSAALAVEIGVTQAAVRELQAELRALRKRKLEVEKEEKAEKKRKEKEEARSRSVDRFLDQLADEVSRIPADDARVTVTISSINDEGHSFTVTVMDVPSTQLIAGICAAWERRMGVDGITFTLRGNGPGVELDQRRSWGSYSATENLVYKVDTDYDPMG